MSFWTDIDDDQGSTPYFAPSSFVEEESQEEDARCLLCGSADFYVDESTGVTHCSDCFTQSQTLSQVDVVGDEDVEAIAARSGGRMMARRTGGGARRLRPDDGLDDSAPLPPLTSCCCGMQMVLKMAADRAAMLAGLDGDRGKKAMAETVKAIWFGYLKAWHLGAKRYRAQYPQLRFSMRDSFIGEHRRRMILRHLSAGFPDNVDVEGDTQKMPGQNAVKENKAPTARTTGTTANKKRTHSCHGRSSYSNVVTMLNALPSGMMDAEQAALRLQPSMALAGSIVLLALVRLRAGVSSQHITAWATNGSFPYLLNAYVHLPRETQDELKSIRAFFAQDMVPPAGVLDYQLDLLAIACNMKLERPPSELMRSRKRKITCSADANMEGLSGDSDGPATNEDGMSTGKRLRIDPIPYTDNIGLEAARLVSDLGFGQHVLDTALALVGLQQGSNPDKDKSESRPWVPPPLKGVSTEWLVSPLHVMAVVVIAVKMSKGWEEWHLGVPMPKQHEQNGSASRGDKGSEEDGDNESDCSVIARATRASSLAASSPEGVPKQAAKDSNQRFVPCTEAQLRLVGSGRMLNDYFDFVEQSIVCEMPVSEPFVEFMSKVQKRLKKKKKKKTGTINSESPSMLDDTAVEPNTILAGAMNPNNPRIAEPNQNDDPIFSTWFDANAVGKYIIYSSGPTESSEESNLSKPFHPQYGLLIEYMAFKAGAEPSELHRLVSQLEKEVEKAISGRERR